MHAELRKRLEQGEISTTNRRRLVTAAGSPSPHIFTRSRLSMTYFRALLVLLPVVAGVDRRTGEDIAMPTLRVGQGIATAERREVELRWMGHKPSAQQDP